MQNHSTSIKDTDPNTALYNELFGTESEHSPRYGSLFGSDSDASSEGFEDKRNGDEADDEEEAVGQIECVQGPMGDIEMQNLDDNSDDNSDLFCRSNGQYSFQFFPISVQLISIKPPTQIRYNEGLPRQVPKLWTVLMVLHATPGGKPQGVSESYTQCSII